MGEGKSTSGRITVVPATAARWDDIAAAFGSRGDPAWCWCQWFLAAGDLESSAAANRAALHDQVARRATATRARGLLAYRDSEPVGWVQLGPVGAFPRVTGNARRTSVAGDDPAGLWRITCFVVPPRHRRAGVARALLDGAVAHARDRGADVLEAHPVDTGGGKAPGANLFHGVLSSFLAAGFAEVGRTGPKRPIVRLDLRAPGESRS